MNSSFNVTKCHIKTVARLQIKVGLRPDLLCEHCNYPYCISKLQLAPRWSQEVTVLIVMSKHEPASAAGLVTTRVDQNNISHVQVSPTRSQLGPHWPQVLLEPVLSVVTHLADKMNDQHMHTVQTPAKRAD